MSRFTHLDGNGDVQMVNVGDKRISQRSAQAEAWVCFPPDVYQALRAVGGQTKKGTITDVAHIAGIMGAKQTAQLIPLCHALPLDKVGLSFTYQDEQSALQIVSECHVEHKTGVEMEALTAVSIAALTIYDMCKALSHDIVIKNIQLLSKQGGKADFMRNGHDD